MAAAKKTILEIIASDPMGVREAMRDSRVKKALEDVGVMLDPERDIRELHAPGPGARTSTGHGVTLCNSKGTRHQNVTCKKCLKLL